MAAKPKVSESKAVAKPKPKDNLPATTATALPDFMQKHAGKGHENIGTEDVEIPRIKLIQAISPEVEEFDEAKAGEFWHSIAEVSLGANLKIVPIYIDQRFILWRPRADGGGIIARADDGIHWSPASGKFEVKLKSGKKVTYELAATVAKSGLDQWGSSDPENEDSPPAATKMYNIVAMLPDFPELSPAIITLQRSGIKPARKFLGKLKISRAPSYGMLFDMTSTREEGPEGPYYNYKLVGSGLVTDEDEFGSYFAMHENFKSSGVRIKDIDGLQDDDTGTGGTDEPEADEGKGKGKKPNY